MHHTYFKRDDNFHQSILLSRARRSLETFCFDSPLLFLPSSVNIESEI